MKTFKTRKNWLLLLMLAAAFINFSATSSPESQARTIVNKMLKAIETHRGCQFTMRSEERILSMKNGLRGGDIFTKINIMPQKTYMKMVTDPNKGTEILYVDGERNNKALVNPGKFLPTIKLNPYSSLLTKDQHHTLLSSGFVFVGKIVSQGVKKADDQQRFDEAFKYAGDLTWNGRSCYKLVIDDPTFTYTTYTAKKGENMFTVAAKFLVPEYSMVELDGVKNFEEDLGGKILKIPTSYARKTVMYVDKENFFPVFQEVSDDKGIFERYQFFNLLVNPSFKPNEFTEDFPEYNF
jgi:hypothetical protein